MKLIAIIFWCILAWRDWAPLHAIASDQKEKEMSEILQDVSSYSQKGTQIPQKLSTLIEDCSKTVKIWLICKIWSVDASQLMRGGVELWRSGPFLKVPLSRPKSTNWYNRALIPATCRRLHICNQHHNLITNYLNAQFTCNIALFLTRLEA